jgi:hypothetical protein
VVKEESGAFNVTSLISLYPKRGKQRDKKRKEL